MKLRHLISTILLGGLISSSAFAADFVNAPLTDGKVRKDTSYDIQLVSQNGMTWTYNISKVEGYDLSHWVLGLAESCTVVSASPSHDGVQIDHSIENMGGPSFYGIKWNSSGGTFSFTLDQAYAATDLGVMVKAATGYGASVITGPDCDNPITSSSADDNGETADNGEINNAETDSGTQSNNIVETIPVTLTCPESTNMLGSFDWDGANYVLNGVNVGGIAITGGIEGASVEGANWSASAGTVSAVLVAGSETSATETLSDTVSGSFSNSTLDDDIASVMFCGTEGEQESLGVALPTQGSIVGRVWALACESDCEEYLGAKEVALESADHVLEIIQPDGHVLFVPVSIMR
ncbi:MAG: hypothetical protein VSS52_005970 [Thiotrichaceae bacterium]|nr:hypothetical protein [Thiotrichaceae bacterium]